MRTSLIEFGRERSGVMLRLSLAKLADSADSFGFALLTTLQGELPIGMLWGVPVGVPDVDMRLGVPGVWRRPVKSCSKGEDLQRHI